jgi:glycosyltransferase involved in cell wall biosynthesis
MLETLKVVIFLSGGAGAPSPLGFETCFSIWHLAFILCPMLTSIITPSFRSGAWLKLCIASVADQGVEVEHIVQDPGSDDGTLDWLPRDTRVKAFVEKDQGMYDAINRGLRRSRGDVLAWLNCDEQYLPGALRRVTAYFEEHPETEMLFGDVVMVNPQGQYLAHRKMQTPLKYHTWTCHLSTLSCAMFFRRRVVFDYDLWFDPARRDAGDGEWMVRALQRRVNMAALGEFTSVFTQTGANMSAGANALRENRQLRQSAPLWAQVLRPGWIAHHRVRRLFGGMYFQPPFGYDVYTQAQPERRSHFDVNRPVFHRG